MFQIVAEGSSDDNNGKERDESNVNCVKRKVIVTSKVGSSYLAKGW